MLIEYRNRIAPKVIGHRPDRLFVNADGTPKNQWSVAWLIRTYLKKRAGIVLSSHQFRHLSAKVLLDAEPGSFETVRQLLGHKSLKTTVGAYAGIDSRRAARHHQRLVEEALAAEKPMRRPKKLRRNDDVQQEVFPMRRATNLYLPYAAWPEDDRTRWEAAFKAGTDLFDDRGPAAHLAERTRLQLQYAYGKFLAFLSARHRSLLARAPAERLNRKIIEDYVKWQPASCGGITLAIYLLPSLA